RSRNPRQVPRARSLQPSLRMVCALQTWCLAPIAVELPPLSLFSGAFVTGHERVVKQPSYARDNCNIRQVEDVPLECADMKREKVRDGPKLGPVDGISQR